MLKDTGKEVLFAKLIDLKLEKSKLNREQSARVLDKGLLVYFAFLLIATSGAIGGFYDTAGFFILIALAFLVLFVTSLPYLGSMITEKKRMNDLIGELEAKLKK